VFTFDDSLSGQATTLHPRPNNRVVSTREARWKLAEYYDPAGVATSEWEMDDLDDDPSEVDDRARPGYERTPDEERQYQRLRRKLEETKRQRLQPLP